MLVISQSKPMALPVRAPNESLYKAYEGYDRIDSRMTPEVAGTEYQKYPNMSFLGTGSFGVAYDTGGLSDVVIKYIYEPDEVFAYQFGKKGLPGIVKVFDIQKLQDNIWAVVMEKIKPLNKKDAATVSFLRRLQIDRYDYNTVESVDAAIMKEYRHMTTEEKKKMQHLTQTAYNLNLIPKWVEFHNKLVDAGVFSADDHSGNIGWNSDGNLVLFDLGWMVI